jgi:hypothetical protein
MHEEVDHACFIFYLHTIILLYIYIRNNQLFGHNLLHQRYKINPLTWKADILLMVANPHPLWSLAWYQLPSPYFPIPAHLFLPLWHILYYNDDINNFGHLRPEHLPQRLSLPLRLSFYIMIPFLSEYSFTSG